MKMFLGWLCSLGYFFCWCIFGAGMLLFTLTLPLKLYPIWYLKGAHLLGQFNLDYTFIGLLVVMIGGMVGGGIADCTKHLPKFHLMLVKVGIIASAVNFIMSSVIFSAIGTSDHAHGLIGLHLGYYASYLMWLFLFMFSAGIFGVLEKKVFQKDKL
jgi:hypothetical protein